MKSLEFLKDIEKGRVVVKKGVEANLDMVWKIFSSGDLMSKWWGPKTWPASSVSFDFKPGGHWHYFMQGPDGTRSYGMSNYVSIDEKKKIILDDVFCDENGKVSLDMPKTQTSISFLPQGEETMIIFESEYQNSSDLQKVIEMGFEAGFSDALDNLDNLLLEMSKE